MDLGRRNPRRMVGKNMPESNFRENDDVKLKYRRMVHPLIGNRKIGCLLGCLIALAFLPRIFFQSPFDVAWNINSKDFPAACCRTRSSDPHTWPRSTAGHTP